MHTLSNHDVDAIIAIMLRVKKAHQVLLINTNMTHAERLRLEDEVGVIERLVSKLIARKLQRPDRKDEGQASAEVDLAQR